MNSTLELPEDNTMIFSEVSNEAIGFDSTWKSERSNAMVNAQIETNPLPIKKDISIGTTEMKDISTQTEINLSSNVQVDDVKLAEWLKRIYPYVSEELNAGVTQVFDSNDSLENNITISKYQSIYLEIDEESKQSLTNGAIAFLSISTQNAPIVAISCFPNHESLCDHSNVYVTLFGPKKQASNNIDYAEITKIPVNSCITSLVTNTHNKDMFSGGSISGDLYIWQYTDGSYKELFCESIKLGTIICMSWIKISSFTNDFGLLTCHQDGFVILWKIGKQILKDKTFKITSRSRNDEKLSLSSIIEMTTGSEFVIGTEDGKVLLCSVSQLLPIRGNKNVFDPVVQEFQSHKFKITSLCRVQQNLKLLLISCDLSGEVYVHDTENMTKQEPTVIIKMPLPFKNKIICTKEMDFILSPSENGCLEMFRVENGNCSSIEGTLTGFGNVIQISENGNWIIIGTYRGNFQLFKVE